MANLPSCSQNPSAWYCHGEGETYGQSFAGNVEHGNDLDEPFHTPITALYGGTVTDASYHGWGGQVGISTDVPGLGRVIEYVQHLDYIEPNIHPGAVITSGELLGLSGGQLGYGLHPNLPQYSSGPHVEFGFDAPWVAGLASGMPTYPNTNSQFAINAARAGQLAAGAGPSGSAGDACLGCGAKGSSAYLTCVAGMGAGVPPACSGVTNITNTPGVTPDLSGITNALSGLGNFFNFVNNLNFKDVAIRGGIIIAGAVVIIVALGALAKQ